jgi:hypothetical protein
MAVLHSKHATSCLSHFSPGGTSIVHRPSSIVSIQAGENGHLQCKHHDLLAAFDTNRFVSVKV